MSAFWLNSALGYPPQTTQRARWRVDRRRRQERSRMYTLEQVREQIAEAAWTQSKGYARSSDGKPVAPHQYIVKQRQPIAYSIIRWWLDHSPDSYQGAYGGYKYTYWNDQGWRYWSMGVILNRVPIEDAAQDPMAAPDPNAVDYLATRPAER